MKRTGNGYGVIQVFQRINATKALSRVLGKKIMHIKICYILKEMSYNKIPITS